MDGKSEKVRMVLEEHGSKFHLNNLDEFGKTLIHKVNTNKIFHLKLLLNFIESKFNQIRYLALRDKMRCFAYAM